jgi:YesN/AraC family two-component response regulator
MLSEKILVIDDDIRVIKSLRLILSDYQIVAFHNGAQAIQYLRRPRNIYLVLLDVMMPEMDGLDVLQQIKRLRPDISVIIMTGYASKDIAVQALRFHADDFIEKPFAPEELKQKVRKMLRHKRYLNRNASDKAYRIEKIKNYIERNCKKASLKGIADEMGLSPKYVSRMFREQDGRSFRQYLLQVKIEQAKRSLQKTSITVEALSDELGYQNPESFMRIFKKMEGKTPTQYRNGTRQHRV